MIARLFPRPFLRETIFFAEPSFAVSSHSASILATTSHTSARSVKQNWARAHSESSFGDRRNQGNEKPKRDQQPSARFLYLTAAVVVVGCSCCCCRFSFVFVCVCATDSEFWSLPANVRTVIQVNKTKIINAKIKPVLRVHN